MRWRAFYADGRRYSSVDGPWENLPAQGLVLAFWWEPSGRRHRESGDDAILRVGDELVSVNTPTPAFVAVAEQAAAVGHLKWGQYLPDEAWAQVCRESDQDSSPPEA